MPAHSIMWSVGHSTCGLLSAQKFLFIYINLWNSGIIIGLNSMLTAQKTTIINTLFLGGKL